MAGEKSFEIVVKPDGKMDVTLLSGYPEGTETSDVIGDIMDGIGEVTKKSHKGDDHTHAKTKNTKTVKS
jgi:hypothetical protein